MTLSEALERIGEDYYSNQVSDYGATLKICGEIVKWAVANDKMETDKIDEKNKETGNFLLIWKMGTVRHNWANCWFVAHQQLMILISN